MARMIAAGVALCVAAPACAALLAPAESDEGVSRRTAVAPAGVGNAKRVVQDKADAAAGPDCDPRPETGADACVDAVEVFVPSDGTVVTFTGDTTFAADPDCPLLDPDLTWWEKIRLEECSEVTVDFCCTDPLLNVVYQVMYRECPCDDFALGSAQFGVDCDDGNADILFRQVPAGVYHYPIYACIDEDNCGLAVSRLGPYQLHISAVPSDLEACCVPNTDECQMLCPRACLLMGGSSQGPNSDCDPNPCTEGACCLLEEDCENTDAEECFALGGRFVGGTTCDHGPCIVNDLCDDALLIECDSINDANNEFATTTVDEPAYSCHGAGQGVHGVGNIWFKFVATHESARVDTCLSVPPADDSLIAAFEVGDPENPCDSLTEIGCSDDVAGCIVQTNFGSDFEVDGLTIGETYYIQLGCWTEPDRGNYQLRITCPAVTGACCYEDDDEFVCIEGVDEPECDALGGRYGGDDSVCGPPGDPNEIDPPCGAGACCDPSDPGFCALLGRDDCTDLCPRCIWQGEGIDCLEPTNPCSGACCTGDGDECITTSEARCFDDSPNGIDGAIWTRYLSCDDPGIDCTNSDETICTEPAGHCHLSDQEGHGHTGTLFAQSDRSPFTQSRVADSFVPAAGPIVSECWWGVYANFQLQNPNCTHNDDFRIVYYEDNGGLPGAAIRDVEVNATRALTGNVFVNAAGDIIPEYEYSSNPHAQANVVPGDCYWFEVTNDTGFQNCRWYWATSGDGDGLSVVDSNHVNGYEPGEDRDFDLAWCANVAIASADCKAGTPPDIVAARSILSHGAGPGIDLAIDLGESNGVEPRRGGPVRFAFDVDQPLNGATVKPANVQINCAVQSPPAVASATLDGQTMLVELAENLADADCCVFSFDGVQTQDGAALEDTVEVVPLEGDMNFSRSVTGGDALLVKAHFGELAGVDLSSPKWDYDRSGGVTGGDFSLIKTRFGNVTPACP